MSPASPPNEVRLRQLDGFTIFDLKAEAHKLIDHLVYHGRGRNGIYAELAVRLDVPPEWAHIGKMATMSQVERAIVQLRGMKQEQKARAMERLKERRQLEKQKEQKEKPAPPVLPTRKERKQQRKMQNMLPRAERLAALDKLKKERELRDRLESYPRFVRFFVKYFHVK